MDVSREEFEEVRAHSLANALLILGIANLLERHGMLTHADWEGVIERSLVAVDRHQTPRVADYLEAARHSMLTDNDR